MPGANGGGRPPRLTTLARKGDEIEMLRALRVILAREIEEGVLPRELPPLVKQLREVNAELRELAPQKAEEEEDLVLEALRAVG